MNNNRGNNRRRGRGNNRQQGGQPTNRIDSRARGNAPQMLEKYRKMAHDAHLNGDRVSEEYYLQFADHYFRVVADQKQRQDESRQRRDDRWQDNSGNDRDDGDDREVGEMDSRGDTGTYATERYDAPRRDRTERSERPERTERAETPRPDQDHAQADSASDEPRDEGSSRSIYEPVENPFTRENRPARAAAAKPRRPRRDTRTANADDDVVEIKSTRSRKADTPAGLDPSALPPAISNDRGAAESAPEAEEKPKPKRRTTRRAKPAADDSDETLQAAS